MPTVFEALGKSDVRGVTDRAIYVNMAMDLWHRIGKDADVFGPVSPYDIPGTLGHPCANNGCVALGALM